MDRGTEARLYRVIGKKVRQRRKAAALTQAALADLIHLTRTSITNIERGRQKVSLHHLLRIANELHVELRDLVPTHSELSSATGAVPVAVDGKTFDVPIATAGLIQRFVEEQQGGQTE